MAANDHSPLLRANENAAYGICQIAEALFEETIFFGRLLGFRSYKWEIVHHYLMDRQKAVMPLLGLLEDVGDLQFTSDGGRRIPYCYNRLDWPPDAPLAGYSDEPGAPAPHQILVSLIGNWRLCSEDFRSLDEAAGNDEAGNDAKQSLAPAEDASEGDPDEQSPVFYRILLVGLWTCWHGGLLSAIRMILDLQANGFFPDLEAVLDAISLLFLSRAAVGSDQEIVQNCYSGSIPQGVPEWLDADFSFEWLNADREPQAEMSSDVAATYPDLWSFMLERAFSEIERVRQSASLDEWVLGCADLDGFLHLVHWIANDAERQPVAMRAVMGQLEEVSCDAPSLGSLVFSIDGWAGYARLIGQMFEEKFDEQWKEALCRERLIVPYRIRARLLDLTGPVPAGWSSISFRLVKPYLSLNRPGNYPGDWRSRPFDAETVLADPRVAPLLVQHGISDPRNQYQIVDAELNPATKLAPPISYPRDDLKRVLAVVKADLARQEVLNGLFPKEKPFTKRRPTSFAGLEALHDLYPNNSAVLWELAVACDKEGRPEDALGYAVEAIVLEPEEEGMWQSLQVILHHLGHEREARLAEAVSQYWADVAAS